MKKLLFVFIIILSSFGCFKKDRNSNYNTYLFNQNIMFNDLLNNIPKTILIHGTLFPVFSNLTRTFDVPLGLHSACALSKHYGHGRVAHLLSDSCKYEFDLNYFYMFGWSGRLCFKYRKKAAMELYEYLKNINGPITLIGHSHGGNVALLLEEVAKEKCDYNFKIDRLILLATPVQKATESYITSSIFKKVYALYSSGDFIQVLDPQGFYSKTKQVCRKNDIKRIPWFSKRAFSSCHNLKQAKILIDKRNPGHLDFILKSVLVRSIYKILNILDQVDYRDTNIINITRHGSVNLISK